MGEKRVPRRLKRFHRGESNSWEHDTRPVQPISKDLFSEKRGESQPEATKGFSTIASEENIQEAVQVKKGKISERMMSDIQSRVEASDLDREKMGESVFQSMQSNQRRRATKLAAGAVNTFEKKHSRLPMRTEYDEIVDNLFVQLKIESEEEQREEKKARESARGQKKERGRGREERKGRERKRHGRRGREKEEPPQPEQTPASAPTEDMAGLEIKDMFKDSGKSSEKKDAREIELESMGGLDDDFSIEPLDEKPKKKKKRDI
jgi:hypothetical protein